MIFIYENMNDIHYLKFCTIFVHLNMPKTYEMLKIFMKPFYKYKCANYAAIVVV